ncbi:MAG TPA: diguanylate cyclase [Solirubrobacterales bacterium]|nr:diguanylate cyclase [Solirubrobacterales bacterium]
MEIGRQPSRGTTVITTTLVGAVALALVVHLAHTIFGFGSPRYDFAIEEWDYDFVTMTAALVTLARAALRPVNRLAWGLISIGLLLWASSDLYWTLVLSRDAEPPFPSLADAGYLSGYVVMVIGVAGLARSRVRRMNAIEWTDVVIAALAVAAIGITLLLDYVLKNTSGTTSEVGVAVAYPILDLTTLAVAAAAVVLTGWRPGRGLALVCAGIACSGVGDAVYTYQSLAGTYDGSAWNNSLWVVGTALIAAGALQPDPIHRISIRPEGWRAFASPAIFALVVFAFLLIDRAETQTPLVTTLTSLTLGAIVVRLALTFNENRRLVALLKQDPLTKLGNRSKLVLDLRRLLEEEEPEPHVLTILDLDGFKAYNDSFGHPAGDAVLIRLGRQLADAVDGHGGAYRLGGDEFAILTHGDLVGSAPRVADATRALSEHGDGFSITCSSGSAEVPNEAGDGRAALQLADQRMYAHKDSQRPIPGGEVEAVLVRILQQRLPGLGMHGRAVAGTAALIGRRLGLAAGELTALVRAAELHDIGKIAIPDAILDKPGPLTDEEWDFMRQHTILGERILTAAPSLAAVGGIVRASHENWDGSGYPDGLAGEAIPLAARIIFVCDAYDAMTSDRPYARQRTHHQAIAELRRCAGTIFDPRVVDCLCVLEVGLRRDREPAAARRSPAARTRLRA